MHYPRYCTAFHIGSVLMEIFILNDLWFGKQQRLSVLGPWGLDSLRPKLGPVVAWYAAQTHLEVSWVYREDTFCRNLVKKEALPQTRDQFCVRSGFHFLYPKTETNSCHVIKWVCKASIPSPSDTISTEHVNQQAPKNIGESIQLVKQKIC